MARCPLPDRRPPHHRRISPRDGAGGSRRGDHRGRRRRRRPRQRPARPSTSSPPPAANRSPRGRSSSGRSRSANRSRTTTPIVEISTDKVDMELPAPASGTITEILFDEGDTVTVGQVIARMQAGAAPRRSRPSRGRRRVSSGPVSPAPSGEQGPSAADGNASPVARARRGRRGRRPRRRPGSARGGRVTKADVLAAAGNGAPPPRRDSHTTAAAPAAALLKGAAAALARYMDQSRVVPTATSSGRSPSPSSTLAARSSRHAGAASPSHT